MNLSQEEKEMFRNSAWIHFSIHAEHRLKVFQFYITLSTALLAGSILSFNYIESFYILLIMSFILTFISFVFWKLDVRTRNLVKNAEDAIKHLDEMHELPETDGEPNPLKLFTRDDFRTNKLKLGTKFSFALYMSYKNCFEYIFAMFGSIGLLGFVLFFLASINIDPVVNYLKLLK